MFRSGTEAWSFTDISAPVNSSSCYLSTV